MKHFFFTILAVLFSFLLYSQGVTDALRYSLEDINGTARYSSMSGAFGALGGDLSAINANPAGGAVFLESSSAISLSVDGFNNSANYFGTSKDKSHSDFNLNQAGVLFVFYPKTEESLFRKFTLGVNYQMAKNYENTFFTSGRSNTSIDQYFLGYANGVPLELLQTLPGESVSDLYRFLGENYGHGHQQALLGYQAYIINPVDDNLNNTMYTSAMAPGNYQHDYGYYAGGFNGKYNINIATQIGDDWYAGINFNSYLMEYRKTTRFLETTGATNNGVNRVFFENRLSVLGSGFSMQIGAIHKINNDLRVGLTYDTPSWLRISEEGTQYLETRRTQDGQQIEQVVNPNIINVYKDYKITTPGKITASVAYLFGKSGLLSVDYSYRDFSNLTFKPESRNHFNNLNNQISNTLQAVSSLRVGGEYRYQQFSFRAGTRFEQSPYKDKNLMNDLLGFSIGTGYSFGNTRLDLAYIYSQQEQSHQLLGGNFINATRVKMTNNTVALTLGFSL